MGKQPMPSNDYLMVSATGRETKAWAEEIIERKLGDVRQRPLGLDAKPAG